MEENLLLENPGFGEGVETVKSKKYVELGYDENRTRQSLRETAKVEFRGTFLAQNQFIRHHGS